MIAALPGVAIINEDAAAHVAGYWTLQIETAAEGRAVAIVAETDSDDHARDDPTRTAVEWAGAWWFGYNSEIAAISTDLTLIRRIDLESRFDAFDLANDLDLLFVLAETGLLAISGRGELQWTRTNLDIVTDVRRDGRHFHVTQWDQPPVILDARTGEVVAQV